MYTKEKRIRVCVRKRPLNKKEMLSGDTNNTTVVNGNDSLLVNEERMTVDLQKILQQHQFWFDEVFDESCSNEEVLLNC
ncbi:hypothetical protein Zmor_008896 [Zophobas morio]|uniref:Kinesin motor domain-containing protein n=1 Tax=Zophobas morio TaxID=2755281 RepID=A0AA38HJN0_9CUCU|nr:hypothetical protein Zmor_008896 [Zophobas morio]